MKIALASDHAGFRLKEKIKDHLISSDYNVTDFGTYNETSVDYPDFGGKVAKEISEERYDRGILVCGSGIGMSIVANRNSGVRAALCVNVEMAKLARKHNNSNVLTLGARLLTENESLQIVDMWLTTAFDSGRHLRRIEKIDTMSGI